MATHATASKVWNEQSLSALPREKHFRLRGLEVTRLDTFVDAAFAFVLTLLVISFDEIPSNYSEMVEGIKRIPAFLTSFIMLMIFWLSHRRWSRRYGLENTRTLLLSLAVIFTILVYVYPLRMIFESMYQWISSGRLSSSMSIDSWIHLRAMFNYYSAGFLVMSLLFALIYLETLRCRHPLALNIQEIRKTKEEVVAWCACGLMAVVSLAIANLANENWITLAGWIYAFTYPLIWATNFLFSRT